MKTYNSTFAGLIVKTAEENGLALIRLEPKTICETYVAPTSLQMKEVLLNDIINTVNSMDFVNNDSRIAYIKNLIYDTMQIEKNN